VRWTERALEDLIEIGDFIAEDKPEAARAWVERLRERALIAAQAPLAGRRVPEVDREDIRETYLRSYRILYRVVADGVVVLTIIEGHRRLLSVDADDELLAAPEPSVTQPESNATKAKRAATRSGTKKPRASR
jgi:plasmid stabilization system protein ParE